MQLVFSSLEASTAMKPVDIELLTPTPAGRDIQSR